MTSLFSGPALRADDVHLMSLSSFLPQPKAEMGIFIYLFRAILIVITSFVSRTKLSTSQLAYFVW